MGTASVIASTPASAKTPLTVKAKAPAPDSNVSDVVVPPGTRPGEIFRAVVADGRELTICCPDDAQPGDVLEIDLPPASSTMADSPDASGRSSSGGDFETVEVAVPPDRKPGDAFTVQAS